MTINNIFRHFSIVTRKIPLNKNICERFLSKTITESSTRTSLQFTKMSRNLISQIAREESTNSTVSLVKRATEKFLEESKSEQKEILFEPINYANFLPTENIADEIIDAFNYWMNLSEEEIKFVREMCHLTYESFVMIDDAIDESNLRRGFPTAHKIFGSDRTVVAGLSSYLEVIRKFNRLNKPEMVENLCKGLIDCYSTTAEHMDLNNNHKYPSVEEYTKIAIGKVTFYWIILQMMQCFSNFDKDLTGLGTKLAIYGQFLTDTSHLKSDKVMNFKAVSEDISAGNISLPIILAAEKKTAEVNIMMNIIRQKTKDPELTKYCAGLIEKLGGIEESKKLTSEIFEIILDEIENLGGNQQLVEVMMKLNDWGIDEMYPKHPDAQTKKSS